MSPLRTAATTAAFRRTTHLLVFGCGRLRVSSIPLSDSSGGVFIGGHSGAEGSTSYLRDLPVTDLAGKIAPFPCFLVLPPDLLHRHIIVRFTNFSRFLVGLSTKFFLFFDEYPKSVRRGQKRISTIRLSARSSHAGVFNRLAKPMFEASSALLLK
jgi:hypothetical protein